MGDGNALGQYKELRSHYWTNPHAKRILSELAYLLELSAVNEGAWHGLLGKEIGRLYAYAQRAGTITAEMVCGIEKALSQLREPAGQYSVILTGHAHIDMNWMWGFQETASAATDTFRTMLQLMEEYPDFTYAQSQASVYRILETYEPELLEEIRRRVKEGRWEVTASTWVENDKNMSGNEAILRQMLQAKSYLSRLLDLPEETLDIDFEPDTFGHSANMPEILRNGGVRYYYHCRGYEQEHVYRWKAASGAEVLVYREPTWYNERLMEYDGFSMVPGFCSRYGIRSVLKLYGCGDHGGGPTRAQINRFLEMREWPLMPRIRFGTIREFYHELEEVRENLPVVTGELNYIFTGCYTSQARIKRANMMGERRLSESELMDAGAHMLLEDYRTPASFRKAWENILFNQFHDILPGSGVRETREYALGMYQQSMAAAQINLNHAMMKLCAAIDTSRFAEEEDETDMALGAGPGFASGDGSGMRTGFSGRASGKRRVVTFFNPTQYERTEMARAVLWDWNGDPDLLRVSDEEGNPVDYELTIENASYWEHHYHELRIEASVPGFGYRSYVIEEAEPKSLHLVWEAMSSSGAYSPRVDVITDEPLVLENENLRAEISPSTMKLLSLIDRRTGQEQLAGPTGIFSLVMENPSEGMSAWRIGTYSNQIDLNETGRVRFLQGRQTGKYQQLSFELQSDGMTMQVQIRLPHKARSLEYELQVDWRRFGNETAGVPQLNFRVQAGHAIGKYLCPIPDGMYERVPLAQDVPCLGFMAGEYLKDASKALILMSDCKYGFRGHGDALQVTLLRGSYEPDPTPDIGTHPVRIGIGVSDTDCISLYRVYSEFAQPLYSYIHNGHSGTLPMTQQWIDLKNTVVLTSLKCAEDGKGVILRCFNPYESGQKAEIRFAHPIRRAERTDVLENSCEENCEEEPALETRTDSDPFPGSVTTVTGPASIMTIRVDIESLGHSNI